MADMTININLKVDVDHLSLSDIFDLMSRHIKERPKGSRDSEIEYNGVIFRVITDVGVSIDYDIIEVKL